MTKHGAPDWAKYRPSSATFPVQDLAELAVRLGSPVAFDRRGDVILLDSFEFGFPGWIATLPTEEASVAITPTTAWHGGYSIKLTTRPVFYSFTQIERFIPYPHISRIGYEYAFSFDEDVNTIWSRIAVYTGTVRHSAAFKYLPQTQELQIYTKAQVWVPVKTNVVLDADPRHFHRLKIVIDLTTETWVRLLLDDIYLDLSAHAYYLPDDESNPKAHFAFYLRTNVTEHRSAYLDSVIITQDEP